MPKSHQQIQRNAGADTEPSTSTALVPAPQQHTDGGNDLTSKLATVAAIGIGAALIEVEWIPGILIGAAAALAPNLLPRLGNGIRPLVKGAMKAGYAVTERTKETVAEASEQFQDMMAEVRSEHNRPQAAATAPVASETTHQPA